MNRRGFLTAVTSSPLLLLPSGRQQQPTEPVDRPEPIEEVEFVVRGQMFGADQMNQIITNLNRLARERGGSWPL